MFGLLICRYDPFWQEVRVCSPSYSGDRYGLCPQACCLFFDLYIFWQQHGDWSFKEAQILNIFERAFLQWLPQSESEMRKKPQANIGTGNSKYILFVEQMNESPSWAFLIGFCPSVNLSICKPFIFSSSPEPLGHFLQNWHKTSLGIGNSSMHILGTRPLPRGDNSDILYKNYLHFKFFSRTTSVHLS